MIAHGDFSSGIVELSLYFKGKTSGQLLRSRMRGLGGLASLGASRSQLISSSYALEPGWLLLSLLAQRKGSLIPKAWRSTGRGNVASAPLSHRFRISSTNGFGYIQSPISDKLKYGFSATFNHRPRLRSNSIAFLFYATESGSCPQRICYA